MPRSAGSHSNRHSASLFNAPHAPPRSPSKTSTTASTVDPGIPFTIECPCDSLTRRQEVEIVRLSSTQPLGGPGQHRWSLQLLVPEIRASLAIFVMSLAVLFDPDARPGHHVQQAAGARKPASMSLQQLFWRCSRSSGRRSSRGTGSVTTKGDRWSDPHADLPLGRRSFPPPPGRRRR